MPRRSMLRSFLLPRRRDALVIVVEALALLAVWACCALVFAAGERGSAEAAADAVIPAEAPARADVVALALELNGRLYPPDMAIVVQPRQMAAFTLRPDTSRPRLGTPPIENAGEGRGPGFAHVDWSDRTTWDWTAGMGMDASPSTLKWRAPAEGGRYVLAVRYYSVGRILGAVNDILAQRWGRADFNILVPEEYDPAALVLNGFPIGVYPDAEAKDAPIFVQERRDRYATPRWFVKVTAETRALRVSPGFTLGDLAMDPAVHGDRQYLILSHELVDRLELIRERAAKRGWGRGTVRVLRGFLTPLAADALRKKGASISEFSRFLWGDAAAIVIDNDGDGRMDDLDRDGSIGAGDAAKLAEVCEEVEGLTSPGGLGIYGAPPDATFPDTPFVHIDARGARARWEHKLDAPAAPSANAPAAPSANATPSAPAASSGDAP